jgi:hypothetical protein
MRHSRDLRVCIYFRFILNYVWMTIRFLFIYLVVWRKLVLPMHWHLQEQLVMMERFVIVSLVVVVVAKDRSVDVYDK